MEPPDHARVEVDVIDGDEALPVVQAWRICEEKEGTVASCGAAGVSDYGEVIREPLAMTEAEPTKTPKGGMQRLERAHKAEAVTKLKNKRTTLAKARK